MEPNMLEEIFKMQLELNDYVFEKNNIKNNLDNNLSMQAIMSAVKDKEMMVNDLPNKWLVNYSKAMKEELYELDDELLWKWWSKDKIDMQNIRVELIDILHFLISAMMCAGLTADKVFDIYQQKHAVNIKRQNSDYNKKTKTEDDNREIT
jgi:dimeric dUTPase (all-alpha-NTP-PPase superfamily)|tara:strand:- start:208 stop:657 length:450 start_codon:yes stop_codon:yes gene_type:complete